MEALRERRDYVLGGRGGTRDLKDALRSCERFSKGAQHGEPTWVRFESALLHGPSMDRGPRREMPDGAAGPVDEKTRPAH